MHEWFQAALDSATAGGPAALLALALATLVSEDLACIAAGLLVTRGALTFAPATAACAAGIFGGDLLLVLLGRTVGRRSLAAAPLRWWVSAEAVRRAEGWFARRGPSLILASRFMPGARLPTYVAAGMLGGSLLAFAGWFALACALWTPLLVGAAILLGAGAKMLFTAWSNAVPALLLVGAVGWLLAKLAVALATWRGRRLLLGRWRRLTRWEFWPMWAVYPPVLAYIGWLSVRHRSLALCTVANPGIGAGGGLVGESKSAILRGLEGAGERIARWTLLSPDAPDARRAALDRFMAANDLAFPIVLKPDVGERGTGVVIARTGAEAEAALAGAAGAMIAQAYVPGVEFGIFYHRRPSIGHGEILAITDKRTVAVMGDGGRTLEELILADDRAVCMATFFLGRFADELDRVPAVGERVALSELGTHCRGALFLDGTPLVTPALRAAVERVSRAFAGFYFGRYDVRAPSAEALQRGEFTVIELNGLTSEATSIYDPAHSLWFGWRVLCRQWRIAFAIAAENRARGAVPLTWREIFGLLVTHTRTS
jgi:membrane protein DedA with SNARE-associated domain